MAYVDHAFSISDEDIMMDSDSAYTLHNRPPIKEIALAVSLLVFGVIGIISGIFMAINRVGGDTGHGYGLFLGCYSNGDIVAAMCSYRRMTWGKDREDEKLGRSIQKTDDWDTHLAFAAKMTSLVKGKDDNGSGLDNPLEPDL
ncbi:hypothetical protein E3N88_36009 [Mikania micrantha]|uniref:Transmembrane protein 230 n=1 Tax=Mikania micrantha TaxID=192012 RepID=A0A5N6M2I9_9ASTR|nr:hypothetical protein E3N88_36009 [Mikania micrantha]